MIIGFLFEKIFEVSSVKFLVQFFLILMIDLNKSTLNLNKDRLTFNYTMTNLNKQKSLTPKHGQIPQQTWRESTKNLTLQP